MAAQPWSRKRGGAAAFQGAEVVGASITRPTEARWRSQDRSASVRVCRRSSSRNWGRRRIRHQKAWSTLCNTCEAVSSQDTFTPCSSEASLWLWFTSSQACERRSSTCGFWRCWRPAYSVSMAPGSPWGTGTWSRRIWSKPAGSKRSTARSPPHRLLPVQEEPAQSSTTSCCPRRWHSWCNRSKW